MDNETHYHSSSAMNSGEYHLRRQRRRCSPPITEPLRPMRPACQPSSPSRRRQRRRHRPRPKSTTRLPLRLACCIAATIGSGGLAAPLSEFPPPSHAEGGEGGEYSSPISSLLANSDRTTHQRALVDTERRNAGCTSDQHTLLFTLYTDTHSILDNSWQFSHASYGYGKEYGNSGTYIDDDAVGTGNLGYGAVLTHALCADKATAMQGVDDGGNVESCYDVELRDANGDGLTAPHSALGGLAGGFSLKIDGRVSAEHRGKACLSDDHDEWHDCAIENGFEYCGLRVCMEGDGGGEATVSNLSGSQCSFSQPRCDAGSATKASSSSVTVDVDTDSYSQELSWEVRQSSRSDPRKMDRAMDKELLLAGGMPVYEDASEAVILGELGVGVPLADNESFKSVACLPDDEASESCFDFRAYDAYGDGMGCGADGALSIIVETPGVTEDGQPSRERVTLMQLDKDMARRQQAEGRNQLACMDEERLSKWSYCAVRVCANGDVIALEGNQCDFGQGEALIDQRYADVDPLVGLEMRPQIGGPEDGNGSSLWSVEEEVWSVDKEEEEEEHVVKLELEDLQLNLINAFEAAKEEEEGDEDVIDAVEAVTIKEEEFEDIDLSWAEYYEFQEPGFRDDMEGFSWGNVGGVSSGDVGDDISDSIAGAVSQSSKENGAKFDFVSMKPDNDDQDKPGKMQQQVAFILPKPNNDGQDKPDKKQGQGQKEPRPDRPNKQQGQKGPRPNKQQGQKGPRPNKLNDGNPKPGKKPGKKAEIQQLSGQAPVLGRGTLDLKRFSIVLRDVKYPYPLAKSRPGQMSNAVADHLLSYFSDRANTDQDILAPAGFHLDCARFKKKIGPKVRWVMDCDGTAGFWLPSSVPLPRKNAVADVIRDAFTGESKEKFLDTMYDRGEIGNKNDEKQTEADKPQDMQPQHWSLNVGIDDNGRSKKKQKKKKKEEKKDAKKQNKLDRLEAKQQQGKLNNMGYVSGAQHMTVMSDPNKGYDVLGNGDIVVYIDVDINGVGGGSAAGGNGRNKSRQRRRRKRNNEKRDGDRRMLRRSV